MAFFQQKMTPEDNNWHLLSGTHIPSEELTTHELLLKESILFLRGAPIRKHPVISLKSKPH